MVHFQVQAVARALLGVVRLRGAPRPCLEARSPSLIRSWPSPRLRGRSFSVFPQVRRRLPLARVPTTLAFWAIQLAACAALWRGSDSLLTSPGPERDRPDGPDAARRGDATCPSKDSHHRSLAPLAGSASHEVGLTFDVFGAAVAGCWVTCSLLGVWRPRGLSIRICTTLAVKRTKPPSLAFGSSSETDSGLVESGGCPHRSDTSPGVRARSALSEHRVGLKAPPSQRRSAIPSRSFADPQGLNPR